MAGVSGVTTKLDHWRTHTRLHHGSHRQLLSTPSTPYPMDVDAIIVPTGRNAAAMRQAMRLAGKLNCTLMALCSKYSSAAAVAAMPEAKGIKLIALDAGKLPQGVLPAFRTCDLLKGTKFARNTDTSAKRNLGLLLARLIGWNKIVFLDDDITVPEPLDLREAAGLTSYYAGVGLNIEGMRDNSVVCHAYREAGGKQDVFVGGGALAVAVNATTSFFPNIYNEDWFFLLDDDGLKATTLTGKALQREYDPFAHEDRARREEFGDTLAEGLFWLLDEGRTINDADEAHWQDFLGRRRGFIAKTAEMVGQLAPSDRRSRMFTSLEAACGRSQLITPRSCVRFVEAWHQDRLTWRQHLERMHWNLVVKKRMAHRDRRTLAAVRRLLCSLELRRYHLSLPVERLDHDPADLDGPLAVAVGE
ncbi:MAG TPA: hypothetical protein VNQ53_07585 [Nocardioides sp.]|nr:hypothetical protein [Nocardioides sp.]